MQLRIIKDTNNQGIGKLGKIDGQVGMELANGYKVVKVNDKSVIAEHDGHTGKFLSITSIYYTEATRWGFTGSVVNHQAEKKAAIARKFERGEAIFQQHYKQNITLLLEDAVERAGYEFAKKVQAQRQLAISNFLVAELETAEGEDSKKFVLTFEVSTPTSDYRMSRTFETESENLARDEAVEMEWQLCSNTSKVLFAKLEVL